MKTALEILNQVEPNGELLDTEQAIRAMEAYADQFRDKADVSDLLLRKNYEKRIDDYVEEQYKLNNIEEYEKSWMAAIITYWYHQGQISNNR